MIYALVKDEPKYVGRTTRYLSGRLSQYRYNVRNKRVKTTAGQWMETFEDMSEVDIVLLEEDPDDE